MLFTQNFTLAKRTSIICTGFLHPMNIYNLRMSNDFAFYIPPPNDSSKFLTVALLSFTNSMHINLTLIELFPIIQFLNVEQNKCYDPYVAGQSTYHTTIIL